MAETEIEKTEVAVIDKENKGVRYVANPSEEDREDASTMWLVRDIPEL